MRRGLAILSAIIPVSCFAKTGAVDYSWGASALATMHDYIVTMMLYVLKPTIFKNFSRKQNTRKTYISAIYQKIQIINNLNPIAFNLISLGTNLGTFVPLGTVWCSQVFPKEKPYKIYLQNEN